MRFFSIWTVAMLFLTSALLCVHGAKVFLTSDLKEKNDSFSVDNNFANECDCGEYGLCEFKNGQKKCTCTFLSKEFKGKCVECNCGKNSGSCSINTNGTKICNCYRGYVENNGVCTVCDCDTYGFCTFEFGQKKCICSPGFIEVRGSCNECNCGKFSTSCSFYSNGTKICNCYRGYVEINGICTECDCGDNGLCKIESGQKKCICSPGYFEVRGKCQACECGEATYSCNLDSSGKKICTCLGGYLENNGTCEECYCGRSGSCKFEDGLKKCLCEMYYSERNGTCKYCSCGKKSSYCYFDSDLVQRCECYKGYAEKDGRCEECDCGYYGSCMFENGEKRCNCTSSSVEIGGWCTFTTTALTDDPITESSTFIPTTTTDVPPTRSTVETSTTRKFGTTSSGISDSPTTPAVVYSTSQDCDCGPRGRCALENGEKQCICDKYTSEKDGKCVDCYCGEHSKSCLFNRKGEKTCLCSSGYSQVYGFCYECSCGYNAKSCSYTKDGTKECLCDIGYSQIDGKCSAVCKENNCLNGRCEVVENGYKCRCDEGFTGQYCEEKIRIKPSKQDIWMIMILCVTLATFVLLSGMFCCWTRLLSKMYKK